MAQRLMRWFKRHLVLLWALPLIASACQGTETGNPQFNPSDGGGETGCLALKVGKDAAGSDAVLDDLILAVCQRLIACGAQATIDACVNALNATDGDRMTDEFGSPEGTTIGQLRADLISGVVSAFEAAADDCETDIRVVACEDVTAQVPPGDFSGVENLIPDSCLNVFETPSGAIQDPTSGCP